MDRFTALIFNNRKALYMSVSEIAMDTLHTFNHDVSLDTLEKCYDEFGFTWNINDGYIVGAGW